MPRIDSIPAGVPCWIDLMTSDPDKARSFYGEIFSWTADEPNEEFGGYINFHLDGVRVAGCMKNDGSGGPDVWSIYLATDDAKATVDAAKGNGGGVIVEPVEVGTLGTMIVLTDAGGAVIGGWQPGDHKGFGVVAEAGAPAWFELHTRDYDASVDFYKKVFGWDAHTAADEPDFKYTTLGEGESQAAGIMDASGFLPEGVPAHWSVYFQVENADATLAQIGKLGGSTVMAAEDTPYGRLATATDPTGTMFKLIQSLG